MKCHLPLYKLKAPCHRCGYLCSNSLEYTAHLHSVHPCTTGDGIETYKLSVLKYYLPGTNCQLSYPLLMMYIKLSVIKYYLPGTYKLSVFKYYLPGTYKLSVIKYYLPGTYKLSVIKYYLPETYKLSGIKYYLPDSYKLSVTNITYHVHTNCQLSYPLLTRYIQTVSCQILLSRYIQTVSYQILLTRDIQTVSYQILFTR